MSIDRIGSGLGSFENMQKGDKTGASSMPFEASYKEVMDQLREQMQDMREAVKNGETEAKFQIGNEAFSVREWNRLLGDFDRAEEELKEEVEQAKEEAEQEKLEEILEKESE